MIKTTTLNNMLHFENVPIDVSLSRHLINDKSMIYFHYLQLFKKKLKMMQINFKIGKTSLNSNEE